MDDHNNHEIKEVSSAFDNQTFKNWKMVLPARDLDRDPVFDNNKITMMKSGMNKVHNIEKGVARYCPH